MTFRHIQCLDVMYAEVVWVIVSSGTQVQSQVILDPDFLSVSYDYDIRFDRSKILRKYKY